MRFLQQFKNTVNPFIPNAAFLYPLKSSECFQGVQKSCIGSKRIIINPFQPNVAFYTEIMKYNEIRQWSGVVHESYHLAGKGHT